MPVFTPGSSLGYRKVKFQAGLIEQNPTTKDLILPTGAQVYLSDKTTVATIYADETGTALTNSPSVPTGVADGAPGIDAIGNLVFFGDPTQDYSVLVNGHFLPIQTTWVHHADVTDHLDGTDADPHNDRAYADTNKVDKSTLGVAGGTATLDSTGVLPANQWVFD